MRFDNSDPKWAKRNTRLEVTPPSRSTQRMVAPPTKFGEYQGDGHDA